jgi:pimeloyl-ACP methyl ester carboxylesterase
MIGVVLGIDRHEVDGVTLAVRSWSCPEAAWPPIVLLHGTGATAGDWDAIAARLCADRSVFAVDLRGHGESSWPGTYTVDAGHLVHATKPDAFLAALTAFLNA